MTEINLKELTNGMTPEEIGGALREVSPIVERGVFTYRGDSGPYTITAEIPEVSLDGDFRITYTAPRNGMTIGQQASGNNYILGNFSTVKIGGYARDFDESFLSVLKGSQSRYDIYLYTFIIERKDGDINVSVTNALTGALVASSPTPASTNSTFVFDQLFAFYTSKQSGFAFDLKIEDISNPDSSNNRFYALNEPAGSDVVVDSLNGQHGSWVGRDENDVSEYVRLSDRLVSDKVGRMVTHDFNAANEKVFATFSASIIAQVFDSHEAEMEYRYSEEGVALSFHQYGDGGETIQTAIDDAPGYITNINGYGYSASNVNALVHIGGNDVSNSVPYYTNKDSSDFIINMESRLNTLYGLLDAEGYNIIWLNISWRNYAAIDQGQKFGSLPYNQNIVEPFIRDTVGVSSWSGGDVRYDFYEFTKAEFVKNPDFLRDAVHPSYDYGEAIIRDWIFDWSLPLFEDV